MKDILSTMKNTSRKPYIYKVTNLETHQYYIGSQCRGKTVGVNYFTSSTNKEFQEGFKNYGEEKYKIEIIKEFDDWKKCNRAENYMIRNYMLLKDGLCLNRACCCSGEKIFSRVGIPPKNKGIPLSEETRKKISEAHKGHPGPNKGIPRSEETKQKISETLKGRPAWNKGLPGPNKGTHLSEETRKKLSEALKGTHLSEETKQKMSRTLKGRPATNQIKISIENIIFDSLTGASKYYNVGVSTIRCWVKNNKHNAVYIK